MSEDWLKYRLLKPYLPTASKKRVVILTGARQTGKTTLARQCYKDLRYVNLDAPENRESVRSVETARWGKDIGDSILDEAQKEPVVFDKVKYAFDEGSLNFCVLLGSSQILLLKRVRESLAGRASVFEIWPLMMSELYWPSDSEASPPLIDRLLLGSRADFEVVLNNSPSVAIEDSGSSSVENYLLQWGGMPSLLQLEESERWKWLKDYEYTYLERDLEDLARLDDLLPFRTFQRLCALRSASLLNYSDLARDASISVDSARRYLQYLRLSYQTILLQPYFRNITSTVIKTPKLYWIDIGLLRQLAGLKGPISGQIYETMVVSEFYKWIKTSQREVDMFFYRTRSGLELDLLLKTQDGIIGVEIKNRRRIVAGDFRAMKEIAEKLGAEWIGGIVVYLGNILQKIAEPRIWAVPSRRLFI